MVFCMAQLMVLGQFLMGTRAAAEAPATQPAGAAAGAAAAPPSAFDPFTHTRLFQLAEGKQTTNLHEMLQPAFWIDTIKELVIATISFIPRLLVAVLFLVVFWLVYRAVRRMVVSAMDKAHVDASIRDMLIALTRWTVMGFGGVIACNQIGIPIVAMLTGVSILGLAVGFAAQETLANFIAGVVIFWDKPFKVGDWLTVDSVYGRLQRITFRSCRLLNNNGELVIFPNTFMLAQKVANHTTHPVTRIAIPAMVPATYPVETARRAILQTVDGDPRVRSKPAPEVVMSKIADTLAGVAVTELTLRFWITDEKMQNDVVFEYNERVKRAVDQLSTTAKPALAKAA
jgi:small conductance mechanosensitive channel